MKEKKQKKERNIRKNKIRISVVFLTLFFGLLILAISYSYALFTIAVEKSSALSIVAGELNYQVDGSLLDSSDNVIIPANTVWSFELSYTNLNDIATRYQLYYQLLNGEEDQITIGVKEGTSMDTVGDSFNAGQKKAVTLIIKNWGSTEATIHFGVNGGLVGHDLPVVETPIDDFVVPKEIRNVTTTGYDIYVYAVPSEYVTVRFPTWTLYGDQDDLFPDWTTNDKSLGTNLGNGTWKYHVDIADHNNEAGYYRTDIYGYDSDGTPKGVDTGSARRDQVIRTDQTVELVYLTEQEYDLDGSKVYGSTKRIENTFTIEFDAKPQNTTPLFAAGSWVDYVTSVHSILIIDRMGTAPYAGVGVAVGTNGVQVIAHAAGYYYSLLSYSGPILERTAFRLVVSNNVAYLYLQGKQVATGVLPVSPITTLFVETSIGQGIYGSYQGYANHFNYYNYAKWQ